MKKKLAMLFVVIMVLSCMPVMAGTVPAGADAATAKSTAVTTQAVKRGWKKEGNEWRYYVNGVYKKDDVVQIGDHYFGFDSNGYLQKGFFQIRKNTFFASTQFGPTGKSEIKYGIVLTGYHKIGKDYYYFMPTKRGKMVKGFIKIGKKLYYFNESSGKQYRKKGWFFLGNAMYYCQSDGTIAYNTTIDGIKIGPTGAVTDPYGMDKKAQGHDSNTRYLILVNKTHHVVNIYKGSKGSWGIVKRNIPCTIGKKSTPTKSGNFKLSIRSERAYGYKDFSGSTAFYATRINAGNFFHSILYKLGSRNPYTAKIKDAALGKNKSNSCIRLPLDDAKYIWTNLPRYTRTVVYD